MERSLFALAVLLLAAPAAASGDASCLGTLETGGDHSSCRGTCLEPLDAQITQDWVDALRNAEHRGACMARRERQDWLEGCAPDAPAERREERCETIQARRAFARTFHMVDRRAGARRSEVDALYAEAVRAPDAEGVLDARRRMLALAGSFARGETGRVTTGREPPPLTDAAAGRAPSLPRRRSGRAWTPWSRATPSTGATSARARARRTWRTGAGSPSIARGPRGLSRGPSRAASPRPRRRRAPGVCRPSTPSATSAASSGASRPRRPGPGTRRAARARRPRPVPPSRRRRASSGRRAGRG